ncbi:MAG: hypothetical protein ACK5O2_07830 [Microthrixaceae bacterium]
MPDPATIAVAYSNLDGEPGFDEGADRYIAKLVDTDLDRQVSVGDTITFGAYPLDFGATSFGELSGGDITVTKVVFRYSGWITVEAAGFLYGWNADPGGEAFGEGRIVANGPNEPTLQIREMFQPVINCVMQPCPTDDLLNVDSGASPSAPSLAVRSNRFANDTDDAFIDVDIIPAGEGVAA